jgi:hypothetical protein
MLSLGLVLAFSASAMAVDVKFSGSFYAAGMYLDKTTLQNTTAVSGSDNVSTAFYFQRLRVQTDFIVSPGLKLVTRIDAMERAWGAPRSTAGTGLDTGSAGTAAENENIVFDWAYINYASPIGTFDVGYMNYGATGTIFGNSSKPVGRIKYSYTIGPATINANLSKIIDYSNTAKRNVTYTDADQDAYQIEGVYTITKDAKVGLAVNYYRYADNRIAASNPYIKAYYQFTPYAIAKIGPVALQAELIYAFGDDKDYELTSSGANKTLSNLAGWIDATADFGPVYFGGTFAYISGDDPGTTDKIEGGTVTGGIDWNPTLIMFNQDRVYWAGALPGYDTTTNTSAMSNAWFGQGRIGVRPITALDIMASLSYAAADQKPSGVLNSAYGWEVDVTGTYKITNNLSYMMGLGYLFTGDYYKGSSNANTLRDNYMLINKLTLTF